VRVDGLGLALLQARLQALELRHVACVLGTCHLHADLVDPGHHSRILVERGERFEAFCVVVDAHPQRFELALGQVEYVVEVRIRLAQRVPVTRLEQTPRFGLADLALHPGARVVGVNALHREAVE